MCANIEKKAGIGADTLYLIEIKKNIKLTAEVGWNAELRHNFDNWRERQNIVAS